MQHRTKIRKHESCNVKSIPKEIIPVLNCHLVLSQTLTPCLWAILWVKFWSTVLDRLSYECLGSDPAKHKVPCKSCPVSGVSVMRSDNLKMLYLWLWMENICFGNKMVLFCCYWTTSSVKQVQSPKQRLMPLPCLFSWEVTIHTRREKEKQDPPAVTVHSHSTNMTSPGIRHKIPDWNITMEPSAPIAAEFDSVQLQQ